MTSNTITHLAALHARAYREVQRLEGLIQTAPAGKVDRLDALIDARFDMSLAAREETLLLFPLDKCEAVFLAVTAFNILAGEDEEQTKTRCLTALERALTFLSQAYDMQAGNWYLEPLL